MCIRQRRRRSWRRSRWHPCYRADMTIWWNYSSPHMNLGCCASGGGAGAAGGAAGGVPAAAYELFTEKHDTRTWYTNPLSGVGGGSGGVPAAGQGRILRQRQRPQRPQHRRHVRIPPAGTLVRERWWAKRRNETSASLPITALIYHPLSGGGSAAMLSTEGPLSRTLVALLSERQESGQAPLAMSTCFQYCGWGIFEWRLHSYMRWDETDPLIEAWEQGMCGFICSRRWRHGSAQERGPGCPKRNRPSVRRFRSCCLRIQKTYL